MPAEPQTPLPVHPPATPPAPASIRPRLDRHTADRIDLLARDYQIAPREVVRVAVDDLWARRAHPFSTHLAELVYTVEQLTRSTLLLAKSNAALFEILSRLEQAHWTEVRRLILEASREGWK